MTIAKVLVANRGEIAVRIIRACREAGIGAVAIFSEADRDALHVQMADEAYPIGPSPATESYLAAEKIVGVAKAAGADAVHPGYGFLAENAAFAEACAEAGLTFIGPPPAAIRAMGDKTAARRHIEGQVLADGQGCVVHLGERECSIQRRHQKLVEESPSPFVDAALRERLGEAACRIAQAAAYVNAGTVEFLVDAEGNFYFLEMNTRLQVEHPVTELVTGIDLVREQLRIAGGEPLGYGQPDVRGRGVAIECRINAEDPFAGWLPSPGTIRGLRVPSGPWVRDDSGVYEGYTVSRFYDTLLAKLIRSEEHTSELQSRLHLVCRLLLEKKKN